METIVQHGKKFEHHLKIFVNQLEGSKNLNEILDVLMFTPFEKIIKELQEEDEINSIVNNTKNLTLHKNINSSNKTMLKMKKKKKTIKIISQNNEQNYFIKKVFQAIEEKFTKEEWNITNEFKLKALKFLEKIPAMLNEYYFHTFDLWDFVLCVVEAETLYEILNILIKNYINYEILLKILEYLKANAVQKFLKIKPFLCFEKVIANLITSKMDKDKPNILKEFLKYQPSEIPAVLKHLLDRLEMKTLVKLYRDIFFKDYFNKEKEIFKGMEAILKERFFNYHNFRFANREITLEQLVDYFENESEILSDFVNRIIRKKKDPNYFKIAFYILKQFNFNGSIITLDEINRKILAEKLCEFEVHIDNKLSNFVENIKQFDRVEKYYKFFKLFSSVPVVNITYKDYFGPREKACIHLPINRNKVHFLNSEEQFDLFDGFAYDGIIAIDCEWKCRSTIFEEEKIAIMQLADRRSVIIVDMIAMEKNHAFLNKFEEILQGKTVLGYSLHNDLKMMKTQTREIVSRQKIIDIEQESREDKNRPISLKRVCEKIFNKSLCKAETVTNWERRPLREKQLHYAALDSFILIQIFHEIKHTLKL
jgi:hypothetical protein